MIREWQIRPREPFNSRIWAEIAAELFKSRLLGEESYITVRLPDRVQLVRPKSAGNATST